MISSGSGNAKKTLRDADGSQISDNSNSGRIHISFSQPAMMPNSNVSLPSVTGLNQTRYSEQASRNKDIKSTLSVDQNMFASRQLYPDARKRLRPCAEEEASDKEEHGDERLEDLTPEQISQMSRSERKRHREKKRRSDVNRGFDELMSLLIEIDPEVRGEAEERARRGQWKGSLGAQEDNLLSRVDLISRTIDVLRRIHGENEQRKEIISVLTRGTGGGERDMLSAGDLAASSERQGHLDEMANTHAFLPTDNRTISGMPNVPSSSVLHPQHLQENSSSLLAAIRRRQYDGAGTTSLSDSLLASSSFRRAGIEAAGNLFSAAHQRPSLLNLLVQPATRTSFTDVSPSIMSPLGGSQPLVPRASNILGSNSNIQESKLDELLAGSNTVRSPLALSPSAISRRYLQFLQERETRLVAQLDAIHRGQNHLSFLSRRDDSVERNHPPGRSNPR